MPLGQPSSGAAARRFLGEAAWTVLAGLLVVGFCVSLLWHDPRWFWHDDFQSYFLPAYCDAARALRAGELPLLSPAAGRGAAIAGEYQAGVFSAFLMTVVVAAFALGLSLPAVAAVIFISHAAVLAMGAFRLARRRGLNNDLALLVALVASLNGYLLIWGKVWAGPMVSFAWVPWLWWALHGAADERRGPARFVPAGVFVYLVLTAGWPFSVLMGGLLSFWFALQEWSTRRRLLAAWPVAVAGLLGLALAAPAWMTMREYFAVSVRGQWPLFTADASWFVPVLGLLGLGFPALVTHWNVYGVVKPHQCVELTGALVPLVILISALRPLGRPFLHRRRWEWSLLALLLILLLTPLSVASFRWSFRWLPLFFLVLALLAAHARAEARAMANPGVWSAGLVAVGWLAALLGGLDPTAHTLWMGGFLMVLSLAWALVERLGRPALRVAAPCVVVLLAAWPMYAGATRFMDVPNWPLQESIRDPAPLDPARRYWSVYTADDVLYRDPQRPTNGENGRGAGLYFGLTCLYSGVEFFHGYTAMSPPGLSEVYDFGVHGCVTDEAAARLLTQDVGPQGMLALAGVDGLVVADSLLPHCAGLEAAGWQRVTSVDGGSVYHRLGLASPRVQIVDHVEMLADRATALMRLRERTSAVVPLLLVNEATSGSIHFGPARVVPVREARNAVEVDVTSLEPAREVLVVFARQWLPGYRATLDGRPVSVEALNLTLAAARLPAGANGRLVLEYRPRGVVVGGWLAGIALAGMLGLLLLNSRRRRQSVLPEREDRP